MRNIRIADPSIQVPRPRMQVPHRPDPIVSWLATLPILALPVLLILAFAVANANVATDPALTVDPAAVQAGSAVAVRGGGFERKEVGVLHWDGMPIPDASYSADGRGRIRLVITLPTDATPGAHSVTAVLLEGTNGMRTAMAPGTLRATVQITVADSARLGVEPIPVETATTQSQVATPSSTAEPPPTPTLSLAPTATPSVVGPSDTEDAASPAEAPATPEASPSPSPSTTPSSSPSTPGAGSVPFGQRPGSGAIHLSSCSNVVIEGKTFRDLGPGVVAIRIENCSNVTIRAVDFLNVAQGVYVLNSSNVTVVDSRYSNITGPAQPRTGANVANFVQFNGVSGGLIGRNKGKGGDTEDVVSVYKSNNVIVEDNHFEGTDWTSNSGSGIALGDGGGSSNIARRNILVNVGQVGAFIAGGTNNQITDNIIIGEQRPDSNVGIYVWNQSSTPCSGSIIARNRVFWRRADGLMNAAWNGGNCATVSEWATNAWDDQSLLLRDYAVQL